MSTRDDASLTDRERAALASLEAVAAAEDPQLAKRLRGASRRHLREHVPRIPAWVHSHWWAIPLLVVGLALAVVGISTTLVLSVIGLVLMVGGLLIVAQMVERRLRRRPTTE